MTRAPGRGLLNSIEVGLPEKITAENGVFALIEKIVREEPDIRDVHGEE